jgi:hypothetical protein
MTNPDPMPDDRTQPDYAAQTTAALQQWTSSLKRDKALAQLHDLAPHHPGARHVLDYLELSGVDTRSRFVPSLEHITVDKLQAIAALSTDPADIPTIHTRRAGAIWQLLGAVTI